MPANTAPTPPSFSTLATDPIRNFRFLVSINPANPNLIGGIRGARAKWNPYIGFTAVSGLAMQIDSIPYREGGYNTTVHQLPGQATFSPITLSRGVTIGTKQNHDWTKLLFSTIAGAGKGGAGQDFRATVRIDVLDHPVTSLPVKSTHGFPPTKVQFKVHNAWISSLAYSDLNAGDNALFVEQMTLVHEGFEINWATSTAGTGAGNVGI